MKTVRVKIDPANPASMALGRIEPRAKKRRPKPLALLLVPRCVAREQIRARRA
jgi:hypothetical protein